jgi:hypothetical protein
MTPQQLYDEIEPVLMAFQLAGMNITRDYMGDGSEGDRGFSFYATKNGGEGSVFCMVTAGERSVTIDIIHRFWCSYPEVSLRVAEELREYNDSTTA